MGMAFGVVSTTILIAIGYNPAVASAVVNVAKIGTAISSGWAHVKYKNVDWHAMFKVGVPGSIGGFVGAVLLSNVDLSRALPWTSSILLILGLMILYRFTRTKIFGKKRRARARWLAPLGLVGGVVNATGGGGWGPVVTTTLTATNALTPRKAIGTTNTSELFVAIFTTVGFLFGLGYRQFPWQPLLALLIGGLLAAPLAAWLVKKAPQRIMGVIIGGLIVLLNVRQLLVAVDAPAAISIVGYLAAIALWVYAVIVGIKMLSVDRLKE
jgi:uncharacterized membrane protein YfcA